MVSFVITFLSAPVYQCNYHYHRADFSKNNSTIIYSFCVSKNYASIPENSHNGPTQIYCNIRMVLIDTAQRTYVIQIYSYKI